MAKGDKKKRAEKPVLETSSSKLLADDSAATLVSEPQTVEHESAPDSDQMTASFVSQPPLTDTRLERRDDECHEVPVLPNIIIQKYEGEKYREQFHGEGVAYFQGGHVYKGVFSEGVMHGRGEYTWADGVKYEGEFVSNVPLGPGTYSWLDGSCYEGEVFNGIRHGLGTYRCADASVVYRGQWDHGKRHGKGTIYYNREMSSWYEGDWVTNHREGWGVRCYPSGNTYEGQWKNNVRHGEGQMRWLQLGQQYRGTWENGVQHGQGTHTWYLKRVPGSQYPLRNEYRGGFVQGLRHGEGSFHYASGALYQGQWQGDKKHGRGKFTFKNGRVFEGDFLDDRMAEFPSFSLDGSRTPDLSGIRTHTPRPEDGDSPRRLSGSQWGSGGSGGVSALMGPDTTLDISGLLEKLPESHRGPELKQVEFAVLRHIAELRSVYSFYSGLGHAPSPDNTSLLSRLQLWRLLKDCSVRPHAVTLAQFDRHVAGEGVPPEEIHSPFSTMLLRTFLSCVVVLAYHTYHKDIEVSGHAPRHTPVLVACFSRLMTENIIPNAKTVKGLLFSHPVRAVVAVNYIERCWEIYQAFCRVSHAPGTDHAPTADHTPAPDHAPASDHTMTIRHFVWMFKDLGLFDSQLTTRRLLEVISAENPAAYSPAACNLDLEMTFLEFFEALLGCAEVKGHGAGDSGTPGEPETGAPFDDARKVTHWREARESPLQAPHRPSPLSAVGEEEEELEAWIQRTHRFFSQVFYPAYDHSLLLDRELREDRLRRAACARIQLAKAREQARDQARLREQWEAEEEERRREEEEDEEAEREGLEDLSPAAQTPVASTTSVATPKQPAPAAGAKKKKK